MEINIHIFFPYQNKMPLPSCMAYGPAARPSAERRGGANKSKMHKNIILTENIDTSKHMGPDFKKFTVPGILTNPIYFTFYA